MDRTEAIARRQISPIEVTLLFTAFIASAYGFGIYLFATLAAEMKADLDLDYGTIGLATGIAQGGFLAASLLSGVLAPRLGPLRLILGAVAATATALLLMTRLPVTDSVVMLTALLTIMGAAAAAVWVPMVAVAQAIVPLRHRAKALGLMSSGTAYGVFVNGLVIPPVIASGAAGAWRDVWLVMGLIAVSLLALGFWRLRPLGTALRQPQPASAKTASSGGHWQGLLRPLPLLLIATMFLNGLACMPFQTYLAPLLQEDLGQPVTFAARIWSVIGVTGMVGGFLMGLLADRISIKWAMVATYLVLSCAGIAVLAVSTGQIPVAAPMIAAAALFALAFNAIYGLVPAYISTMFQGGSATLLFGLGNIAIGLGGLVGNITGGYAKDGSGSFTPIYAIVAVAAIAQILLALATPNERKTG